jgi:GT2 family glycosyltransferase
MRVEKGLVSIIILNWNGLGFTKACLKSLEKDTVYRPFEVIVVDNGSSVDEVQELKRLFKAGKIQHLILNDRNRGFSGGNNQGMKAASGEFLLLLNNDVEVKKGWLKALVEDLEKHQTVGIIGPRMIIPGSGNEEADGGGTIDSTGAARPLFHKSRAEVEAVGGAALLFRRSVYDTIGGLEEGFNPIYFEEMDFCCRARKAGFKIVYLPESVIIHFEGKAMKKAPSKRTFVTINKNRLRYTLLHFSRRGILKALVWELGRFLRSFLYLKPHWLLPAYWITLKSLPEIIERRSRYARRDFRA